MAININGSGTITGVSVGGLPDGIVDTDMLATDAVSAAKLQSTAVTSGDLPTGSILQVVSTDVSSPLAQSNNGSFQDLTGFSRSITSIGASSQFLVQVFLGTARSTGNALGFLLLRDSTAVGIGDANGSRTRGSFRTTDYGFNGDHDFAVSWAYLDSPSASAGTSITYKLQGRDENADTIYINRNINYTNTTPVHHGTFHSSIIVTEIAG